MKGTFKIATFFGIPVQVHWSFVLIIVWVAFSAYSNDMDLRATMWLMLLMLTMFLSVVMHEYGHALTARKYGVTTRDIILLPIGGVARLEQLPERPIHEFWVAIAGPLVNIGLAIVLSLYFFYEPIESVWQTLRYENGNIVGRTFIPYLITMNVVLAVFNLIPAFPMDGGRILRAILSMNMGKVKATRIASIIGQVLAVGFVILSVYPFESPMFTLLGIFIFFVARQENNALQQDAKLSNVTLAEIVKTEFTRLEPHDTIQTVHSVSEITKEQNFVVVNEVDQVIGVLHHQFLEEAIQQEDLQSPVMLYMSQHYQLVTRQTSVKDSLELFQREGYSILPVVEEGKLIGVVEQSRFLAYLKSLDLGKMKLQKQAQFTED